MPAELNLTKREKDILHILWGNDKPMTASEIVKKDDSLTINTVQAVLRKLMGKELIKVADIVYSNTVLCRSYVPAMTAEEVRLKIFCNEFKKYEGRISVASLVDVILKEKDNVEEEIEGITRVLEEIKKKMK